MKEQFVNHKSVKKKALKNANVKIIYSSLEEERVLLMRLAEIRRANAHTQADISSQLETSKNNISRLERNTHSPMFSTLRSYIQALGYEFDLILYEK